MSIFDNPNHQGALTYLIDAATGNPQLDWSYLTYTSPIDKQSAVDGASYDFYTNLAKNGGFPNYGPNGILIKDPVESPYPHGIFSAEAGKRGFLPPESIYPTSETLPNDIVTKASAGGYIFQDWRGHILKADYLRRTEGDTGVPKTTPMSKWDKTKNFERSEKDVQDKPYTFRDIPLIFGDLRGDYFRNGLQVIDEQAFLELPTDSGSTARLDNFKGTPWELNDPVFFGFDIIFEAGSSPLLNGSVLDFLRQYSNVNEFTERIAVYEEFKNQFKKLFRVDQEVAFQNSIDDTKIAFTKAKPNSAMLPSNSNIHEPGRLAYMGYYLKKVTGLDLLIEQNKGNTLKYFADYRNDFISLDFYEDVSLSVGALAHLYKLLYWSKPQGKMIVPDNLLRFNCKIIISEFRNFMRVNKSGPTVREVKDNLSRYVYSLKECQFYFDKMPHPNEVSVGGEGPAAQENYSINFDFKYSTLKMERFVPQSNYEWGTYVGYDAGAIWKIGNAGARDARKTGSGGSSTPRFFTSNTNTDKQVGVEKPKVLLIYGEPQSRVATEAFDVFKLQSEKNAQKAEKQNSLTSEAFSKGPSPAFKKAVNFVVDVTGIGTKVTQAKGKASTFFNTMSQETGLKGASIRQTLLNQTLDKAFSNKVGGSVQKNLLSNIPPSGNFFDTMGTLKNDVANFAGGSMANKLFGGQ
jgi:hypothetical protein